ncbi:MAG: insulinase family protein [Pseudomonadota bacterium]
MYAFPRALGASLALLSLAGPAVTASAQSRPAAPASTATSTPVAVDRSPWLFKGSDIEPNPAWSFGTLPNGVRYAVRRNNVPPGQVSIRVRIDAGSLYEDDGERGFAHFLEHLAFRGSEHVPDGEAKRIWQRLGATFGSDSNAQTTPTQTVYRLDLPSATEAGVDESLKILEGMMDAPTLTDASIAAERPVVLSEQREQPGPQIRVGDAQRAVLFAGQPLADRSPIGNVATLEAATADTVARFHDRWYRPERTVVAISGDMDPALLERLVIKNFSGWAEPGGPTPDPDFGKPDPSQPAAGAIVEATVPGSVSYAVLRPWKFNADTVLFNQNRMVDTLATLIITRRLEQRARAGGSYLLASVSLEDVARSVNGTFVQIVPIGDDWRAALRDARAVIAEAGRAAPSAAEVALALSNYDSALKNQADTAAAEAGSAQADDIVGAVDIREAVASPAVSYKIFTDARAAGFFTRERVLASTKRIFQGDATRAFLITKAPTTAGADLSTQLSAALKADVARARARRSDGPTPTFAQLPLPAVVAKEVGRETIAGLDMTQLEFDNGVRLIVFPTKAEENRVYVKVRFGRGLNALPVDRDTPAWAAPIALAASGIGKIDQEGLDRMTAGRRIGLDFAIDDDAFEFAAATSPTDLADQLRLIAAKLYRPRWDAAPVVRARVAAIAGQAGENASPDAVLQRRLEELLHAGDPRWGTPPLATLRATTPARFKTFWAPYLATGPIEVQVFGDVTLDQAIDAVARSLGALPRRSDAAPVPPPVRFPEHVASPVKLTHDGNPGQAAAVIAWPAGAGSDNITEARRLDVLAAVFSDRLFEKLRQASGVSYSPNVGASWPRGLPGGGRILALGQVAPDKTDFFLTMAREIAADLVANPIGDDELQRILGPIRQSLLRASTGNTFWMRLSEGATRDPKIYDNIRAIGRDFATMTPADLQATAARYFRPEAEWSLVVLPTTMAAR